MKVLVGVRAGSQICAFVLYLSSCYQSAALTLDFLALVIAAKGYLLPAPSVQAGHEEFGIYPFILFSV